MYIIFYYVKIVEARLHCLREMSCTNFILCFNGGIDAMHFKRKILLVGIINIRAIGVTSH